MNAEVYIDILNSELIPFTENLYEENWIFQQDNAPIHVARATKAYSQFRNIQLLDWPALSLVKTSG